MNGLNSNTAFCWQRVVSVKRRLVRPVGSTLSKHAPVDRHPKIALETDERGALTVAKQFLVLPLLPHVVATTWTNRSFERLTFRRWDFCKRTFWSTATTPDYYIVTIDRGSVLTLGAGTVPTKGTDGCSGRRNRLPVVSGGRVCRERCSRSPARWPFQRGSTLALAGIACTNFGSRWTFFERPKTTLRATLQRSGHPRWSMRWRSVSHALRYKRFWRSMHFESATIASQRAEIDIAWQLLPAGACCAHYMALFCFGSRRDERNCKIQRPD